MTCEHCGQSFASQDELDTHMQQAHPGMGTGQETGETPTI